MWNGKVSNVAAPDADFEKIDVLLPRSSLFLLSLRGIRYIVASGH